MDNKCYCNCKKRRPSCCGNVVMIVLGTIFAFLLGVIIGAIPLLGFLLLPFAAILAVVVLILLIVQWILNRCEPRCECHQKSYEPVDVLGTRCPRD